MQEAAFDSSARCLANLSSRQVSDYLTHSHSLIVPVAGLEPCGIDCPIGISARVCESITGTAARESGALCTPLIPLSGTLAFSAFPGAAGIRPVVLVRLLCDCISAWYRQGFTQITLADISWGNGPALQEVSKRLRTRIQLRVWRMEDCAPVRTRVSQCAGSEPARLEYAVICAACSLGLVAPEFSWGTQSTRPPDKLKRWQKRGCDPEQLRKLAPDALWSPGTYSADPVFGAEILDIASRSLTECIAAGRCDVG